MYRDPGPIHHAPWDRRFKTHWFCGSIARELQVGPLVFMWCYERHELDRNCRLIVWRDRFWRQPSARKRFALWGA